MNETSTYALYQAKSAEGKVLEVVIMCLDPPDEPYWHLHIDHVASVESVLEMLKHGDKVWAQWNQVSIPVEVVHQPSGEETIEVMRLGQPSAYQSLANLPCFEEAFSD